MKVVFVALLTLSAFALSAQEDPKKAKKEQTPKASEQAAPAPGAQNRSISEKGLPNKSKEQVKPAATEEKKPDSKQQPAEKKEPGKTPN